MDNPNTYKNNPEEAQVPLLQDPTLGTEDKSILARNPFENKK